MPTGRNKRDTLPESIDWEALGCVNAHRWQQTCGCCWAFSVICTLEGAYCKKTGNLLEFSEQDLVDCYKGDCTGSQTALAFDFVKARGNLLTCRASYPYIAEAKMCTVNKSDQVNLGNFEYYRVGDTEEDMKEALSKYGPVTIGLKVGTTAFKQYSGGIIYPDMVGLDPVTGKGYHAVNLIGYHTDPSGEPVYYGRNSWKETWGINNGNFLLARTPLWSDIGNKGMVYAAEIL
jgi:C1A family cysteine protease